MKLVYIAIFEEVQDGFIVTIPTLDNIMTQGDSLYEAIFMARDLIKEYINDLIDDMKDIPEETNKCKSYKLEDNQFTTLIDVEL